MIGMILAASVLAQAPSGAEGMTIQKYLRSQMHVYDEAGAYIGPIDQGQLPSARSLIVVRVDGPRVLVRKPGGKQIELRVSEVLMDGAASTCSELVSANRQSDQHRAAGDVGATSGLATQSLPCVK
jgi:hypothetical protein